jgi:AcrR family transcriptional regulator
MEHAVDTAVGLDEVGAQLDAFLNPDADPRQARKRQLILKAATELFIAYGYRKTTIDDVASAAGVAKGTVYLYYRNKAQLFLHAIALQKQQYLDELAPVFDASRPPRERLHALIVLSVELSHRMPLLTRFVNGDPEMDQVFQDADAQTLDQINESRVDFMASLIDEATEHSWPAERVRKRAGILMNLVFAAVRGGGLLKIDMPLDEFARELADVIVGGVLSVPGPGDA